MSSGTTGETIAKIDSSDDHSELWERGREIAIRMSGLRKPYWRLMRRLSSHRPYSQLIPQAVQRDGDVAECGVFRGRTLLRLATYVQSVAPEKTIHGFDSFQGFPPTAVQEGDLGPNRSMTKVKNRFKRTGFARQRIEQVAKHLQLNLRLHAGYFENTLPKVVAEGRRFCFIHLDCDIYESYKTCLNAMYDALVPGGIILFDEYACPVWPGATRAVDEFFAELPEKPLRCDDLGRPKKPRYYVVKEDRQPRARCA